MNLSSLKPSACRLMIGLGLATACPAQIPCAQPQYLGGFINAPNSPGGGALSEDRPVRGPDGSLYFTLREGGTRDNGAIVRVSPAGILSTVYDFEGTINPARGSKPGGGVIFGTDGQLYGHTTGGGSGSKGTLFRCTTSGTVTTLHNFTGTSSTPSPIGSLCQAADGNFYGMTQVGGAIFNAGTVFRLTPAGGFTEIAAFTGSSVTVSALEGARPQGSLVERVEGGVSWLYGVLGESGGSSNGRIFKFALPAAGATTATLLPVVRFSGSTGSFKGAIPSSGLTLAPNDTLYGTTSGGGTYGYGTVYAISPQGNFSTVFEFGAPGTTAGLEPNSAPVIGTDGFLYGTSSRNGGGVYRLSPTGTNSASLISYSPGGPIGQGPISLIQIPGGDLMGLSIQGGPRNRGVLFRLRGAGTAWTASMVLDFGLRSTTLEGAFPTGGLVSDGTLFYGTTEEGGSEENNARGLGTIFSMTATGQRTTLLSFTGSGAAAGQWPRATLLRTADGLLYGTTSTSGPGGGGTVFRFQPSTRQITTLATFSGQSATGGSARGSTPSAALTDGGDGFLYGTTRYGGTGSSGLGTIFKLPKAGGPLQTLADFTGTGGSIRGGEPIAGLTAFFPVPGQAATAFYGVTTRGGTGDYGTLFRITPSGTYTTLVEFTGSSGLYPGGNPHGTLAWKGGKLYGTTRFSGPFNYGTVFRFDPATNAFATLAQLGTSASNVWHGREALAGLTLASDGLLYGTTSSGLAESGYGTIFRLENNDSLTPVANFSGFDKAGVLPGSAPPASGLTAAPDGDLYGTAYSGGPGNGTLFKIGIGTKLATLTPLMLGNGSARLRGYIMPNSTGTTVGFELVPTEELPFGPPDYFPLSGTFNGEAEFSFNVSGLQAGVPYLVRAVSSGPCGNLQAGWLEFTRSPVYPSWKSVYFDQAATTPSIAGDGADPDNDRIPNLIEFMTGTSPLLSSGPALESSIGYAPSGQRRLNFSYFRRENADAGETLTVQTSQDLITWQTITAAGGSEQKAAGPVSNGDGFQWQGWVPATGSRRYLRLKATRP